MRNILLAQNLYFYGDSESDESGVQSEFESDVFELYIGKSIDALTL